MSFLTPFYLAGLLAVSLPIVFHLIRREPSRRVPFSTLMFLRASPPRVTHRRRIEHWLLLLLRAAALCLLALAFARPFLREHRDAALHDRPGRDLVMLLDTSASMKRASLWSQAVARARTILEEASEQDCVAVLTFDRSVQPLIGFEEWSGLDHEARRNVAAKRLDGLVPGWLATDLGNALVAACEALANRPASTAASTVGREKHVCLISDLQSGSRLDDLQSYPWPQEVALSVEPLELDQTTNAAVHLVTESVVDASDTSSSPIRLRVSNAADSVKQQFVVRWSALWPVSDRATSSTEGLPSDSPPEDVSSIHVFVPPGQSRVVRAPKRAQESDLQRLILEGDDHGFDNVVFVCPPTRETLTVLYLGPESADDPKGPLYYLVRAFPETQSREVRVLAHDDAKQALVPMAKDLDLGRSLSLVVIGEAIAEGHVRFLREYARRGGTLVILGRDAAVIASAGQLLERSDLVGTESDSSGYAMLTNVDFSHPVLAPFSDARFADFTRLHVWKHRAVALDASSDQRILARFDDGHPALVEIPFGAGRAFLFCTSWQPADSEMALSSKFAPILNGILNYATGYGELPTHYIVGDPVTIGKLPGSREASATIWLPDGRSVTLPATHSEFSDTSLPGLYTVRWFNGKPKASASLGSPRPAASDADASGLPLNDVTESSGETGEGGRRRQFAVNLDAAESKTEPMPIERLESLGVRMAKRKPAARTSAASARARQMSQQELESRQRLWRWLILAAITVLFVETWLGWKGGRGFRIHFSRSKSGVVTKPATAKNEF